MTQTAQAPTTTSRFDNEPAAFLPPGQRRLIAMGLLDRALEDYRRAERQVQGSMSEPLYRPEIRWDMVRTARQLLDDVA